MQRTRDERRHHRERVIANRLDLISNAWGESPETFPWAFEHTGRFAKYNLKCTCSMCKLPRYDRSAEKKQQRRDIDDYFAAMLNG